MADGHAIGHLERSDAGFELRVLLQVLAVHLVQLLHQIELSPLFLPVEVLIADVLDHPFNGGRGSVDACCLQISREKC